MIFHTAAEKVYYNAFFKMWHRNIDKHVPNAKFSLKFVGDTSSTDVVSFCKDKNIDLILDCTTIDTLIEKYRSLIVARGYYPMARWNSIPIKDEHVCVTDVDVIMLKNDIADMELLFEENDFISVARGRKRLMVNYIHKDACAAVLEHSKSLMDSDKFRWDLDLDVMSWMLENLRGANLNQLAKFDSTSNRLFNYVPNFCSFGYYSSVGFTYDEVHYPDGFEAKKAKYNWASKTNTF